MNFALIFLGVFVELSLCQYWCDMGTTSLDVMIVAHGSVGVCNWVYDKHFYMDSQGQYYPTIFVTCPFWSEGYNLMAQNMTNCPSLANISASIYQMNDATISGVFTSTASPMGEGSLAFQLLNCVYGNDWIWQYTWQMGGNAMSPTNANSVLYRPISLTNWQLNGDGFGYSYIGGKRRCLMDSVHYTFNTTLTSVFGNVTMVLGQITYDLFPGSKVVKKFGKTRFKN